MFLPSAGDTPSAWGSVVFTPHFICNSFQILVFLQFLLFLLISLRSSTSITTTLFSISVQVGHHHLFVRLHLVVLGPSPALLDGCPTLSSFPVQTWPRWSCVLYQLLGRLFYGSYDPLVQIQRCHTCTLTGVLMRINQAVVGLNCRTDVKAWQK